MVGLGDTWTVVGHADGHVAARALRREVNGGFGMPRRIVDEVPDEPSKVGVFTAVVVTRLVYDYRLSRGRAKGADRLG